MPNTLTPSLYARIRPRRYAADRVISFFGNDVVLTGRVTSDLVTPRVWAQFDYDMSTGDFNDVKPGMYMVMGIVNDITQATYIEGRARYDENAGAVATATTIYCNESSQDFSAEIGYFWILNNFMPQIRLSTEDAATQTQKTDWNRPYQGIPPRISGVRMVYADSVDTGTGKLRIAVDMSSSAAQESGKTLSSILTTIDGCTVLAGSLSGYMFIADIDPGKQWAETTLIDSGSVEQTRYWFIHAASDDFPPDVGMLGNAIENRFDSGWTMTLPAIAGVDDLRVNCFAAAWRTNQQTVLADGTWKTGDLWGGASATITNKVLTSNVATITTSATHAFLPGQSIIVISDDSVFNGTFTITTVTDTTFSYAKTHANVGSASATGMAATNADNVDFAGWMQTENDPLAADMKYSVLSQANLNFTGIGPRMARLFGQQLGFLNAATATVYEQIVNCTPYRVIARFLADYSTVATLANIDYDAYDNTYLFSACIIQAQDMLSAIKTLLYQINANPEWSANGGLHFGRDATFLDGGERAPLPILVNWTSADPMTPGALTRDNDPSNGTGKVDADGTFYQTDIAATGQVFTSRSPGTAQGAGAGNDSLRNQILAATALSGEARDELSLRAGSLLDFDNLNEFLHCVHRDATVGLADWASRTRSYFWLLDGTEAGPNGVNRIGPYDTAVYWLLDSRTSVYNPSGTFDEKRDFRRLIAPAAPGDDTTVLIPPENSIEPALPDFTLPAFDFQLPAFGFTEAGLTIAEVPPAALAPPRGKAIAADGQELIPGNDTQIWLMKNFITLTTPRYIEVSPDNLAAYLIQHGIADPGSNFTTEIGFMGLTQDGTNSAVFYNPNILGVSPASNWTKGDDVTGIFTLIRPTKTNGSLLIYSPATTVSSTTVTATFSGGGYPYTLEYGTLDGSGGNPGGCINGGTTSASSCTGPGTGPPNYSNGQVRLTLPFASTVTEVALDIKVSGYTALSWTMNLFNVGGSLVNTYNVTSDPIADGVWTHKTSGTVSDPNVSYVVFNVNFCGVDPVTAFLDNCAITYEDTSSGNAGVALSTDYGASFAATLNVGDSPGSFGGFDVQRAGPNSFAAADAKVRRATTLGGAYSDYLAITGGSAQAACVVVPGSNWAGTRQTAATNPDIVVALTAADGSSRTLIWAEGGASVGTLHDITPTGSPVFDSANCVTVHYRHIACFGLISGVYHLFTSNNRGTTWVDRGAITDPHWIRCRRNDLTGATNGTNIGQLYLAEDGANVDYSSKWGASSGTHASMWPRNMPGSVKWAETVY